MGPSRCQATSGIIRGVAIRDSVSALGRLLSREEQVSDLVAFLAALDPEPLRAALDLAPGELRVRREASLGSAGRADLLVRAGGDTALLEVKEAAAEHGDQFASYDAWASRQTGRPVRCFVASLDDEVSGVPVGWGRLPLPRLVGGWRNSTDPNASWLADRAASVLEQWVTEVDSSPIGAASSRVVADLVTRKAARLLQKRIVATDASLVVRAERDSGGNAALVAWLPHPSGRPDCWLCVGTRSTRRNPAAPWRLRLGVDVGLNRKTRALADARALSHQLAVDLLPALRLPSLRARLMAEGESGLADSLSAQRDGLRAEPDRNRAEAWLEAVKGAGDGKAPTHPFLFHDRGLRLAAVYTLDVASVTLPALVGLLATSLDHLSAASSADAPDNRR